MLGVVRLAGAGLLAGASPRVAVTPPRFEGEVPAHVQRSTTEALVRGLRRSAVEVDPRALGDSSEDCASAECRRALAQSSGAGHLVVMRVALEDRHYALEVELLDDSGRVVVRRTATCELCGVAEASGRVDGLAVALADWLAELPTGPARFIVRSDPPGASVRVDDQPRGTTPLTLSLPPGEFQIDVTLGGHSEASQVVRAQPELEQRLDFRLVSTEPARPPRAPLRAGTALVATGVASIGAGAILWSLDGRPYRASCPPQGPDPSGRCPEKLETLAGGITATAVGLAALGAGVGLLVWSLRRAPRGTLPRGRRTRLETGAGGWVLRF